jgi:hypothetical protein
MLRLVTPSSRLALPLLALVAVGCPIKPHESEPPELDPGEHMLLTPRGNAEELLGRTVTKDESGGYVISDERPPGCEVAVRRVPERWHRTYQQDMGRVAHIGTGQTPIGDLTAQFGKTLRIEAEVNNVELLEADLRGCNGTVVNSVRVGTGRREIHARKESKIEGHAKVKGVPVGGGAGQWRDVERSHDWSDPQAWAFTVKQVDHAADDVVLSVTPQQLRDQEVFTLRIVSARQVYLVVGFIREDGSAGVLLPSPSQPEPVISAGGNVELTLRATLPQPGIEARDTLVLYAFPEKGDFKTFGPPPGNPGPRRIMEYFQSLPDKLSSIPSRRWKRVENTVLITP